MSEVPKDKAETTPLTTLATLAGEWVEVVEAAAAGVIGAELAALRAMAQPDLPADEAAREKARVAAEARIEDGFDNMPV